MKSKEKREVAETLVLILQLGIAVLVPILGCTVFGTYLSKKFDNNLIALALIIVGVIAGFQTAWKLIRKYIKNND